MKTLDRFYNDDWIRSIRELVTPQKYPLFDEIERLRKLYDYDGISKHVEELLRTSREKDEMMKRLAQPLSDRLQELTSSLRMPVTQIVTLDEQFASYSAVKSANSAIADIMEQRKHIEEITGHSAVMSTVSTFNDLLRYSDIGEISLAAQNMLLGVNFADICNTIGISSENLATLERSFLGFTDSYSALFRSIEASKIDISSLDWFVTELPPVEIFTGASLARAVSKPSPPMIEDIIKTVCLHKTDTLKRMLYSFGSCPETQEKVFHYKIINYSPSGISAPIENIAPIGKGNL
jgi:hypothetical protein